MSKPKTAASKKATTAAKPAPAVPKDRSSKPAEAAPTSAEERTYQERMRQLKPHERVQTKLHSTVERFQFILAEVSTWKNQDPKKPGELSPDVAEIVNGAKVAMAALEELTENVDALPKDFAADKPRKTPTVSLEVGTRVNLREKFSSTYEGIIDGKDRLKLEVLGVRKGRVVCKTQGGEKVLLPRGHVELTEDTKKKAA